MIPNVLYFLTDLLGLALESLRCQKALMMLDCPLNQTMRHSAELWDLSNRSNIITHNQDPINYAIINHHYRFSLMQCPKRTTRSHGNMYFNLLNRDQVAYTKCIFFVSPSSVFKRISIRSIFRFFRFFR